MFRRLRRQLAGETQGARCCRPASAAAALAALLQRWPDLRRLDEARRLPHCTEPHCCLADHWSRVCKPETPPPPYTRYAMDDVKRKESGDKTDDARRTDHERLPTGSLTTDGEERPSWDKEWCRLAYWELARRVGGQYGVRPRAVDVFGGSGTSVERKGLCLDDLSGVVDMPITEQVRKTRSKIGLGVTISREHDGVWLYNRSEEPVFVSSPALDAAAARALLVWRVAPGHCLCIFDPDAPSPVNSLPQIGPVDTRSVRISFAKGWGPKYSRRDVTACPCWLEVLLAPPS